MAGKIILAVDSGHGQDNRSLGVFDSGAEGVVSGVKREEALEAWRLYQTLDYVCTTGETSKGVRLCDVVDVVGTRDFYESSCPVGRRAGRAKSKGATLFISLHWNQSDAQTANGTETYYRDSADKELARIVQECTLTAFSTRDRGLKPEGESQHPRLAVLDFDGPACLLEVGFISSSLDLDRITGDSNRDKRIAWATSILECIVERYG